MPFTLTPATPAPRGARARWRVAVDVRFGGDAVVRPADAAAGPGRADKPRETPERGVVVIARRPPASLPTVSAGGELALPFAAFGAMACGELALPFAAFGAMACGDLALPFAASGAMTCGDLALPFAAFGTMAGGGLVLPFAAFGAMTCGGFAGAAGLPCFLPRAGTRGITAAAGSACFAERREPGPDRGILLFGVPVVLARTPAAPAASLRRPTDFAGTRVVARGDGATVFLVAFAGALPDGFRPVAFAAAAFFFAGLEAATFVGLAALVGFVGFVDFGGFIAFAGFVAFTDFAGFVGFVVFFGLAALAGALATVMLFTTAFFFAVALPGRADAAAASDAAALVFPVFAAASSLVLRLSLAAFFFASRFDFPAMVSLSLQQ